MAEVWDIAKYVEEHPDDYEQRWRLAKKLYAAWEYRLALEHLQVLRNEWQKRLNVVRYLAATYYRLGRYDEAVAELREAIETWPQITCRPADLLKPEWEELRSAALSLKGCNGSDEDVLSYAMFPQVAQKFFTTRHEGPKNLGKDPSAAKPATAPAAAAGDTGKGPVLTTVSYDVKLNGKTHKITVAPSA